MECLIPYQIVLKDDLAWNGLIRIYWLLVYNKEFFFIWICRGEARNGYEKRWNELQQYFNSNPHLNEPGTSSDHVGPTPKVILVCVQHW